MIEKDIFLLLFEKLITRKKLFNKNEMIFGSAEIRLLNNVAVNVREGVGKSFVHFFSERVKLFKEGGICGLRLDG